MIPDRAYPLIGQQCPKCATMLDTPIRNPWEIIEPWRAKCEACGWEGWACHDVMWHILRSGILDK